MNALKTLLFVLFCAYSGAYALFYIYGLRTERETLYLESTVARLQSFAAQIPSGSAVCLYINPEDFDLLWAARGAALYALPRRAVEERSMEEEHPPADCYAVFTPRAAAAPALSARVIARSGPLSLAEPAP